MVLCVLAFVPVSFLKVASLSSLLEGRECAARSVCVCRNTEALDMLRVF